MQSSTRSPALPSPADLSPRRGQLRPRRHRATQRSPPPAPRPHRLTGSASVLRAGRLRRGAAAGASRGGRAREVPQNPAVSLLQCFVETLSIWSGRSYRNLISIVVDRLCNITGCQKLAEKFMKLLVFLNSYWRQMNRDYKGETPDFC